MDLKWLLFIIASIAFADRATWLTTHDPQVTSVSASKTLLTNLSQLGVTTIYLSVWNNGNLYANSNTYNSMLGVSNDDYLQNVLTAAEDVGGIKVVAWFEYGNMAAYGSVSGVFAPYAQSKGWLINDGALFNNFVWCDPSNSDYAQFLVSMISEVNSNYAGSSFGGIQLDDHFSWPTGLSGPSNSVRIEAMTNLAKQVSAAVGVENFSLSPNTMPTSLNSYNANWPEWTNLVYEIVPQTYTASSWLFGVSLKTQLRYAPADMVVAGLRCDGTGAMTSWSDLEAMIEASSEIKGVSIWYAKCLYSDYVSQFQELWG